MHVSTTQVLRKFAQKMAAQNKQANPLAGIGAALSDPKTLGTIAGAGGLGLGAYGLAKMTQSDEDREQGSWMPTLAGLAGAMGGGYAGSQLGPQLAAMLKQRKAMAETNALDAKTVYPQPEIADAPGPFGGDVSAAPAAKPGKPSATSAVPNAESQAYLDDMGVASPAAPLPFARSVGQQLANAGPRGSDPELKFTDGQPDKGFLSSMGVGSR
jgi:hypothetical protein